jgi:hypothetical protein
MHRIRLDLKSDRPPWLPTDDIRSLRTSMNPPQLSGSSALEALSSITIRTVCILLGLLLGWATYRGLAVDLIAIAILLSLPILAAKTRWAASVALAPVLLYPIAGLNHPTLLHGALNVKPVMAIYLLGTVAYMYVVRNRSTSIDHVALSVPLIILISGLLESVNSSNGTLEPTLTMAVFWLSAFNLGSLLADDLDQFAALGLCALPLAGLAIWQAATGDNPYQDMIGSLHFAGSVDYGGLQRATSTFGEPLVAGASLTVLAFMAVVGRRRLSVLAAPFVLLGALVTVSRSALLGALLGFMVAGIQRADRRKIAILLSLLTGAVVVAAIALPRFATSIEGRVFNQPYTQVARTTGPQRLISDLSTNPLAFALGNGIGSTSRELAQVGGVGGVDTYDNQFIDTTFDLGFIPVLLAALALGYAMLRTTPSRRGAFLPAVIASIGMLAFFDGLGWPSFAALFWFLFGSITARDDTDTSQADLQSA